MPGKSVAEMIERRFLFEGSSKSYKNCWVIEVDGEVAGDLHAHLYDDMDDDPPDQIVPERRFVVVEPMIAIEKPAYGTFHNQHPGDLPALPTPGSRHSSDRLGKAASTGNAA